MEDGTTKSIDCTRRVLSERQASVLDELQLRGETGVSGMYSRTLKSIKNRLIMDDEYDPMENMGLVRVLTMLERDLEVLGESVPQGEKESNQK